MHGETWRIACHGGRVNAVTLEEANTMTIGKHELAKSPNVIGEVDAECIPAHMSHTETEK
jgi:hypothetical protein